MSEEKTAEQKTAAEAKPWYDKHGVSAEDAGVLGKYKDESEAIKSIGARERYLSQTIQLPKANAKPEERTKHVREIMGRLGAMESAAKYKEILLANLPDDLKGKVPEDRINGIAESAFDDGLLPDVFLKSLKAQVAEAQAALTAESEAESERLKREKKDDEKLSEVWGRDKTTRLKDAETFAKHYDDTLFDQDNRTGMSPEERAEKGGLLFRLLKEAKSPLIYRVFADLQQRIFGEGKMHDHTTPPSLANKQQQIIKTVQDDYAVLGEERINQYAKEHAGQPV